MNVSLRDYNTNSLSLALNIIRFPHEYNNNIKHRITALRFLFQHQTKSRSIPKQAQLVQFGDEIIRDIENNDLPYYFFAEVADILHQYAGVQRYFRQRVQPNIQEQQELKNPIKTVYNDKQNVHDTVINQSVLTALKTLHAKYNDLINVENNKKQNYDYKTQLALNIEVFLADKYPEHTTIIHESINYFIESISTFTEKNIPLLDSLLVVWLFILDHTDKEALEKRLIEEFTEMEGLCTTGHLARIINTIQGFTQDKNLQIQISRESECTAEVKQYLLNMLKECKDDKILDEIDTGGDNYIKYIRKVVADKIIYWKDEYGDDMLEHIVNIINTFANTEIFKE